jgi:uncharacterized protein YbaR (Trm112 family)
MPLIDPISMSDLTPSVAPISPELLALLRCPENGQRLSERQVEGGRRLLVREDGLVAYPIIDGLPVVLLERKEAFLTGACGP